MTLRWIIWPLVACYFATLVFVFVWHRRRQAARMRLIWPASTSQHQMERWGARYLERMGWEVSGMASQSARSILQCFKQGDELFVVFLRDGASFSRVLVMMSKFGMGVMHRLVIVLFEPPSEAMVKLAAQQRITLVHYRDLVTFEDSQSARLPGVMAAREAGRKVQVI